MSARATAWAWRQRGLSLADRAVLLAIADRADHVDSAFLKPSEMCDALEVSRDVLRNSLRRLHQARFIVQLGAEIVLQLDRPAAPARPSVDIVRLREVDGSAAGLARLEREGDAG